MKVRFLNAVKYNHQYQVPGTEAEVEDSVGKHLVAQGAAVEVGAVEVEPEADPVAELVQVDGVDKKVAAILLKNGITNIEELQAKSEADLAAIEGISKKRAKQIAADATQFVDAE